jgi:hypothetical protein
MPKQIDWEAIEQAYLNSSDTLEQVAAQFGVSERAIKGKASEGKWVARRKAQKVVSINDAKKPRPQLAPESTPTREPVRVRRRDRGAIDELEIVEGAIVSLDLLLSSMSGMSDDGRPVDTRGIGTTAGALVKLLEYRRKIQPPTAAALAEQAIALGMSPAEFARELRQAWEKRA